MIKKIIIALLLFMVTSSVFAFDVVVIANRKLDLDLTYNDIESIFTLKNKHVPGTSVPARVVIMDRDSPITKKFARKYLNMSLEKYLALLDEREASGKGTIMAFAESESQMALYILNKPYAIGFISTGALSAIEDRVIIIK